MKKALTVLAGIFICSTIFVGCAQAPVSVGSGTIELDGFDTLDAEVSSYDLTVTLGDSYGIEYKCENGREPEVTADGQKLKIRQPRRSFFNLFGGSGEDDLYYKITVPQGHDPVSITVKSSSGDVTLDRISVSGQIESSSGEVLLNDLEGKIIEAETSSGKIGADKIKAGAVSFGTSSGDVELLRIEADDISCNTSSGKVSLNNSVSRNVMCQTTSGDVEVDIHGSFDDFSCYTDTNSGKITVNGQETQKEYVKDNGEDGKVAVHTTSGDIDISIQ